MKNIDYCPLSLNKATSQRGVNVEMENGGFGGDGFTGGVGG